MASYTIFTDSSCNLPEEVIERYGIEILSLRFMSEGEEYVSYRKGESTDLAEFYRLMRAGKIFTTSLPYLAVSSEMIREKLDAGQDILYIGFSSGLSGTYEATATLLDQLKAEYPERTILHTDTLAAAMGEGLVVLYAAEKQADGMPIEELHAWVESHKMQVAHWFTVEDLMYLYRGGRVSRTSATAANVLNIKPVLHVDDAGKLIPMEKVRGRKRSIKACFEHLKAGFNPDFDEKLHIGISHGDCEDDLNALIDLIKADPAFANADITTNILDPVIGAHSGPGTLALFYPGHGRN